MIHMVHMVYESYGNSNLRLQSSHILFFGLETKLFSGFGIQTRFVSETWDGDETLASPEGQSSFEFDQSFQSRR